MLYSLSFFFFFNDTATTEIYTLSLHDALPISPLARPPISKTQTTSAPRARARPIPHHDRECRSEEHTSELQSRPHLVCRLLLEKKKKEKESSEALQWSSDHEVVKCNTASAVA